MFKKHFQNGTLSDHDAPIIFVIKSKDKTVNRRLFLMATTSELTDTSLNIANTTTINGIESSLSSSASKVATSSAILTAINNSASSVSSYVDSAISGIKSQLSMDTATAYSGDLNNISVTSIYYADTPATNKPEGVNGYVSTIVLNSNYISQHFTTYDGQDFRRVKNNGTWSDWMGPNRLKTSDFFHYSAEFDTSPTTFTKLKNIVAWIPANSFYIASASLIWGFSRPSEVGIGNYNSNNVSDVYVRENIRDDQNHVRCIWSAWTPETLPICVWGRWSQANYNFYVLDVAVFSPTTWHT